MTTLSTHDTKRSEDVRARLLALAELPVEWSEAVTSWRARRHFGDPQMEYLLWQSLAGAWPIEQERLAAYAEKASREAKRRTSWTDPDPQYDAALQAFVAAVYEDAELLGDVDRFVRAHLLMPGRANALAQKLVQLTMPGVPDVYQGSELWDLSLVDPDNRRPVDYALRERLLGGLDAGVGMPDSTDDEHGAVKLLLVTRALRLRRAHPEWFGADAGYEPLEAPPHLLGFVRGDAAVTLATRLPVGLARRGGWADETVRLPDAEWRDELTGERHAGGELPVRRLLERHPVALLVRG